MLQQELIDDRYQILEELGRGSNASVYRAKDMKNGLEVAIKIMSFQRHDAEGILRFKKEVEIMSKLQHPRIVKLFGSGVHRESSYLVMEMVKGKNLNQLIEEKSLSIEKTVEIMRKVSEALDYVHQRDIIHRDLKPLNIIIQNGEIKILDFCLSRLINLESVIERQGVVGTLPYMPPEQAGTLPSPVDERSDLYSLGIIFYEALTSELPFKAADVGSILRLHLSVRPKPLKEINPQVPEVLQRIVLKLLEKVPDQRYQSAKGLVADLYKVSKLLKENKINEVFELGSEDVTGKLNYHVTMIGRRKDFARLEEDFSKVQAGEGKLCLISGPAGMGKTRLIDEFRPFAENKNALFISGKCNKYEATLPYSAFVAAITEYVNMLNRGSPQIKRAQTEKIKKALGNLAATLTQIIPALKEIVGELPVLAQLEPEKERIRFYNSTLLFLSTIASQENPVIIFLDDLQWADFGTLDLIRYLSARTLSSSVYILGSYRDEEVNQEHGLAHLINDLKKQEVVFREVHLQPLNREEIAEMVNDTFNFKGKVEEILFSTIERKSQGNPFYVLQILRALVDQRIVFFGAGRWVFKAEILDEGRIPATLIELLLERVRRLDPEIIEVLSYASVIGRDFNSNLLHFISNISIEKITEALDAALQQIFIWEKPGFERGVYTFSHDRVREVLYEKIGSDEIKLLHEKIAEYLEESSKGKIEQVIYELAYHYANGLNIDKALEYTVLAGQKAQVAYANEELLAYYNKALLLLDEKGLEKGSKLWLKLMEGIGDAYCYLGQYDKSIDAYESAKEFTKDRPGKAKLLEKAGYAFFAKGDFLRSAQYFEEGLKTLNIRIPKTKVGILFLIFVQTLIRLGNFFFPFLHARHKLKDSPAAKLTVNILRRYSAYLYFINMRKGLAIHLLAINLAEHIGPSKELAQTYNDHGIALTYLPLWKMALEYEFRGLRVGQKIKDPWSIAHSHSYLGTINYYCTRWDESIKWLLLSADELMKLGDRWQYLLVIYHLANNYLRKSDYDTSFKHYQSAYNMAFLLDDRRGMGQALTGFAEIRMARGEIEEAEENTKTAMRYRQESNEVIGVVISCKLYGKLYILKNEFDEAIKYGRMGIKLIEENNFRSDYTTENFPVLAEALLKKAQEADSKSEREDLLREAGEICRKGLSLSKAFKNYLGYSLRVCGLYEYLKGNYRSAKKHLNKSVKVLEQVKDKFELAKSLAQIGNLAKKGW